MRKTLLATTALLAALLLLAAPLANATWGHSFTYTKFNTSSYTFQATDKARTSWQVKITNELIYNATTSGTATITLRNATSGNFTVIDLCFNYGGGLDVWIGNGSDGSLSVDKILVTTWTASEPIYFTLDSSGYFNIGNKTDPDNVLKDYVLGEFELNYVGAKGASDVATSGYISVEVSDAPVSIALESTLDIIFAVIPIIFTVAVLGVVIKMFKEVSG